MCVGIRIHNIEGLATSGFSLIALVQPDDEARGEAMGNAVGGLALGVLIGPPLGGFLYHIAGKSSDKHHNTTITRANEMMRGVLAERARRGRCVC